MAILDIIEAPHPILGRKARKVEEHEFGAALAQRLSDMAETMYAAPGVGLAGPQVGDSRRILVLDPKSDGEGGRGGLRMMVNPEIVERSRQTTSSEESCLSVPEFYLTVERAKRVKVRWRDPYGDIEEAIFEDFPATVVQHELDHLDGITLLDRASRLKRSRYISKRRKQGVREATPMLA